MGRGTVVHLLHALNDRAIADVVCTVSEQQRRAGEDVVVVASHVAPGARAPDGVPLVDLGGRGRKTLPTVFRLVGALRELEPVLVVAHGEGPARAAVLAARLARRARPRVVTVAHNHYSTYPWTLPRLRRAADAVTFRGADVVAGVSPGVAEDLCATFPAVAQRVAVLPAPLTRWDRLDELARGPVDHPWFDGERPVVVSVGHVHRRKDHATLVRAIGQLCRERGTAAPRLVIVGSTEHQPARELDALISELGLTGEVELVGERANPLPLLAKATAFALTSRNEGMGIVLLEAMALGVPLVSTDAPTGPRWLLEGGRSGLLTPVGDPAAVAEAIGRLLDDAALREALIARGRERVTAFSPAAVAEAYGALFDDLLAHAPSSPPRIGRRMRARLGADRRRRLRRLLRPVRWGNLRRTEPRSARFGFDRGTPIDRWYLTQFVHEHADRIRGVVGEVSEALYAPMGGDAVDVVEILDVDAGNPRATVLADLGDERALPRGRFDCLIVTQTLQYIPDPEAALRGLGAALRPGGALLLAVPALTPHDDIEADEGDYWRFWPAGFRVLLERSLPGARVQLRACGNVLAATAFLQGISAEELTAAELAHRDARYPVVVCALVEVP